MVVASLPYKVKLWIGYSVPSTRAAPLSVSVMSFILLHPLKNSGLGQYFFINKILHWWSSYHLKLSASCCSLLERACVARMLAFPLGTSSALYPMKIASCAFLRRVDVHCDECLARCDSSCCALWKFSKS